MWRLRLLYTGFEYIRMRRSKTNSREGMLGCTNCNKSLCISNCVKCSLNCSISSRNRSQLKFSKNSSNDARKDLVGFLLSSQSIRTSHISKSKNLEKSSFEISNLWKFEEVEPAQSSSQCDLTLCNEIPLILSSKDEIRKLAESIRTDWRENYIQLPTRNSELLHHISDLHKKSSFDVKEKCVLDRGVNAKIPLKEFLHILDSSSCNEREPSKEREISSIDHKGFASMSDSNSTESSSPTESIEARQPSPVSVLESPLERKRVVADPKELQMQLGLLKHELDSSYSLRQILYTEKEPLHLIQEINLEFSDEEERDFSYLLDMLIDSGFHSASNQKQLTRLCYEPDSPVRPSVWSNLEKKYKKVESWSKSEQKLLFDMINSILAKILAPLMDLKPWVKRGKNENIAPMWGQEGLVEEVWGKLVRMRESLPKGNPEMKVFDGKWIELGGNLDLVGREIERGIRDELIEELVVEFLMGL